MKGRSHFTANEIEQLKQLIRLKLNTDATSQKSIRNKIRRIGFYASDFGLRDGYTITDFLNVITSTKETNNKQNTVAKKKTEKKALLKSRKNSDEFYIINLCDLLLKEKSIRQHRFDFLRGDTGVKLPVDAYYKKHNLVIEYLEKQHSEPVKHFDKRLTVSGVNRREQRKIYDERRKKLIPQNGIHFLTLSYHEFKHKSNKTLVRDIANDKAVIKLKLAAFLDNFTS